MVLDGCAIGFSSYRIKHREGGICDDGLTDAHLISLRVSFTVCQAGGCYKKTPAIRRYAYYDEAGYRISRPQSLRFSPLGPTYFLGMWHQRFAVAGQAGRIS